MEERTRKDRCVWWTYKFILTLVTLSSNQTSTTNINRAVEHDILIKIQLVGEHYFVFQTSGSRPPAQTRNGYHANRKNEPILCLRVKRHLCKSRLGSIILLRCHAILLQALSCTHIIIINLSTWKTFWRQHLVDKWTERWQSITNGFARNKTSIQQRVKHADTRNLLSMFNRVSFVCASIIRFSCNPHARTVSIHCKSLH